MEQLAVKKSFALAAKCGGPLEVSSWSLLDAS